MAEENTLPLNAWTEFLKNFDIIFYLTQLYPKYYANI